MLARLVYFKGKKYLIKFDGTKTLATPEMLYELYTRFHIGGNFSIKHRKDIDLDQLSESLKKKKGGL